MVGEIHRYSHCIQQSQLHKNEFRKHEKVDKFRVYAKKTRICKKKHLRLVFFDVCFFCKKNMFFIKKNKGKKNQAHL